MRAGKTAFGNATQLTEAPCAGQDLVAVNHEVLGAVYRIQVVGNIVSEQNLHKVDPSLVTQAFDQRICFQPGDRGTCFRPAIHAFAFVKPSAMNHNLGGNAITASRPTSIIALKATDYSSSTHESEPPSRAREVPEVLLFHSSWRRQKDGYVTSKTFPTTNSLCVRSMSTGGLWNIRTLHIRGIIRINQAAWGSCPPREINQAV